MPDSNFEHFRVKSIEAGSALEKRWFNIFKQLVDGDLKIEDARNRSLSTYLVDLLFIKEGGKDVGFCMVSYYKTTYQGKTLYLLRPGAGIVNSARGSKFPMKEYCQLIIKFKMQHPAGQVLLFGNAVNPIIYAGFCKYWQYAYPKAGIPYNEKMAQLKEYALSFFGEKELRQHVIKGTFKPNLDEKDFQRFLEQKGHNPHIDFFLEMNPNYRENECLVAMLPLSWYNIFRFLTKIFSNRSAK